MIELEIFSQPGKGKKNEDYVWHAEIMPGVSLIIVCDGMGGLSHGAEAAKLVAHSIAEYIQSHYRAESPDQSLINGLKYANDIIATEIKRHSSKMGTSVGLTLFADNRCYYTWLGDVRIYHAQGENVELLTRDHLAIEGNHSFLFRCINGKKFRYSPEVVELAISANNEIFIVTDGYYIYNEIGSPIESVITVEDDATIVCIRVI